MERKPHPPSQKEKSFPLGTFGTRTANYFLVTQDNDSKLITGLKVKPIYIKAEIDKADIIHSFIPQARTLKE
ncbi:hypothetical protein [Helicobacter pylori]|uniref:hypothetical protein n=1 Tax=Helicobacter pylori TaxID=210 RepID=UPI000EB06FCB|nr:hypothetical protein [Helicobacter pylori]